MRYDHKTAVKPSFIGYFIAFSILGAICVYGFGAQRLRPETIRDMILAWGYWGPLGYVVCNALRPFVFFPAIVLGIAGGLVFGPLWGTLYLMLGTVCGAVLCFGLARLLGPDRFRRSCPKWLPLEKLDEQAARHGFRTVLLLRLAPVLPWDAVSFMAGLSTVRFWPYLAATIAGSAPGAIAFSYLGDSLSYSLAEAAIIAAVIGAMTAWLLYGKRWQPWKKTYAAKN